MIYSMGTRAFAKNISDEDSFPKYTKNSSNPEMRKLRIQLRNEPKIQ